MILAGSARVKLNGRQPTEAGSSGSYAPGVRPILGRCPGRSAGQQASSSAGTEGGATFAEAGGGGLRRRPASSRFGPRRRGRLDSFIGAVSTGATSAAGSTSASGARPVSGSGSASPARGDRSPPR